MLAPALLLISFHAATPHAMAGAIAAEAGLEYDSNANRGPSDGSLGPDETPRGGPLLRGLLNSQLQYVSPTQGLRMQLQAGGKQFLLPGLQDQNISVIAAAYDHGRQFRLVRVGAAIDYYEAVQAPSTVLGARDFRSLSVASRLVGARPVGSSRQHRVEGGLDIGGHLFMFKPDPSFSFLAPSIAGRFGSALHAGDPDLGHDFDLGLHLRIDYRGYMFGRADLFIQGGGSVTWQGPLLVQLGYTVQLDLSNFADESYQRHLVLAKVGFRLPGDFYVTAKTQMNLLQGAPGLFVPVSNIDDDNRSLALLDVERPLPRGFALLLRYSGYFSLPRQTGEVGGAYQRHTGYLGVSYNWKAKRP
jgi:hypothetical protein